MGCGQSKIGSLYSRNKAKHKKALQPPAPSASGTGGGGAGDDDGGGGDGDGEGGTPSTPASPSASAEAEARRKALASKVRQVLSSGPLLAQAEVSSSQLDFFRMLDERIENGPDYISGSDDEVLSEKQSSNPEDESNPRPESRSMTLQPPDEGRSECADDEEMRRVERGAAASAPAGDGVKSPVMNGELRRWEAPPVSDANHHGNGVGGPKLKTSPRSVT